MKQLRTALFWVFMQGVVVISYRRFGTTNRSHPQGSESLLHKSDVIHFSAVNATDKTQTDSVNWT
jgi:hypothetical protein